MEMSESMRKYFDEIDAKVQACYDLGNKARAKGYDPIDEVSIPIAKNMAERVEGLISVAAAQVKGSGVSERIFELEKKYGSQDWRVAFTIALEVAQQKFCKFKDEREACEVACRIGLAYITNGVVSSPLEGFIRLELKDRNDGSGKFFALYFGGPIRSAGTTATCAFVYLCDYVRKKMGYKEYDPTPDEIKRASTELDYFHERITNLQYKPSDEEAEFLTEHLPVQIDGDPSEKLEVPNYKDLPRVETNKMRNGYCLALAEGLSQKGMKSWGKFSKWYKEFEMDHWVFMDDFVKLQKEIKSKGEAKKEEGEIEKVPPDYTFIADVVAGRPVLGYPKKVGTFRLRYGRSRVSGFSMDAVHPASLIVLDGFIAIGTQLKSERPGKATSIASCDSVEGPIVKLKDGSVVFVEDVSHAQEIVKNIEEVIFLGDVLINYGDFLDRAHKLCPVGYCEEWWALEVEKGGGTVSDVLYWKPTFYEVLKLSEQFSVPLHPRYTYHWDDISVSQIKSLVNWLSNAVVKEDKMVIPFVYDYVKDLSDDDPKRVLELIGCPHEVVSNEYVVVSNCWAKALRCSLGFLTKPFSKEIYNFDASSGLEFVNKVSEVKLRDKSGMYIGTRMGRPEKGKMRKLTGSPHGLAVIGEEGGRMRCFQEAIKNGKVNAEFAIYDCPKCGKIIFKVCPFCGEKALPLYKCRECGVIKEKCDHEWVMPYEQMELDFNKYFSQALTHLGLRTYPELIKGIRGTSNRKHICERFEKSILRAMHGIHVNKDGTVRFDMSEATLTHFKPCEIGTSVSRLKELGYLKDIHGKELVNDNQVLELKCQDMVMPKCEGALEEGADKILFKVANFLDDLLEKFYGVSRFYNLKSHEDLVGHMLMAMSPHTAAAIAVRIVGFSRTQIMLAHPLLHSIMRRDTDGDEAGVMLMMDALLNFSRELLATTRGATQDEPLVLTTNLIPAEVDDMVFNMDVVWKYPLELYEAALEYKMPWDVKVDVLENHLGGVGQYEGMGYTHETKDFNSGILCSTYKVIPTMREKVEGQMKIAEKLRAVDENDVARLIIERHFMRDIKGNLRKFTIQQFRCVACNTKYRRPPLKGACTACGGKLLFTIAEGSVIKYLEPSMNLASKYTLPAYLNQTLDLVKQRIELVFGKDPDKQAGLGEWFSGKP